MKHVFVINPAAGKKNITKKITNEIKSVLNEENYYIYITKSTLDAKKFVKSYCEEHQGEKIRFYSCGGDGTLNEVVNGVYGYNNVSVACYPSGSGNDFIKYFGKKEDYLNLNNLIDGKEVEIDLLKINDRFVVNIFNVGFDANVADRMIKYKRLPFVSGKGAYILGIIVSLLRKITTEFVVEVDNKIIYEGEGLLCAVANAICYGGGFYCTPKAKVDDGLIDILAVKRMSRLTFIRLIKLYKRGTHLDEPKLEKYLVYTKGKNVKIRSKTPFNFAIDGEMGRSTDVEIQVVPNAIKFVVI